MRLPKRKSQKATESKSIDILKYKIGDLGIVRNQTESDFGIDLELELVYKENVTGRIVKAQVKSGKDLQPRKDGVVTISGIKQSTLRYWCDISFAISVIVYAVDLKTETIHVVLDVFWQASAALGGGDPDSTKTLECMKAPDKKAVDILPVVATIIAATQPTMTEFVAAHRLALRHVEDFIELLGDAFQYDAGTEVNEPVFKDLLQACRVLLWQKGEDLWADPDDKKNWSDYDYWRDKSSRDRWDGLVCYTAKPILIRLLPVLMKYVRRANKRVLAGKYYWAHKNPEYLQMVYETILPNFDLADESLEWRQLYKKQLWDDRVIDATYFVEMAKRPSVKVKARSTSKK
jgi:hypothetical protein